MTTEIVRESVASGTDGRDDNELAFALARGDAGALSALYDRHGGLALGLAIRLLGDRQAAEDVVQDSFLQIWRRGASFDPRRGTLRSWLLSMVHNRAIDVHRQRAARPQAASWQVADLDLPDSADTWTEVGRRMSRETVARALMRLSPEQREVIELAFFSGYTHVEIADRLQLPLGTVKGRIRLGLQRLRGILAPHECDALPSAAV
jgi:RNA polymerase sigma-70 factor (ECF subfamily)